MATLQEIYDFIGSPDSSALRNKINAAIAIKAVAIVNDGASTAAQNVWALAALRDPTQYESTVVNTAVADNAGLTITQIQNADDAAIQGAVNKVVDNLLGVV